MQGGEVSNKSQCPDCGSRIDLQELDHNAIRQDTYCPQGHSVFRIWNGPENPFYSKDHPYGWSAWRLG